MKFEGILPPAITPLRDDGGVDAAGFAQVIEAMIAGGVHGIVVGGTTGEYYALTAEERVAQFRQAAAVIAGRVPMIAGVNDIRTEGACALATAAREAGADAILIAAPYYSLPGQAELAQHCLEVDAAAGLPVMLYNYPGRTGVEMGEEFLRVVAAHANFRCIKEASGDIDRLHMLARDFPGLAISCGAEEQALEYFAWGATSWVTPMGNFFAPETVALYEACAKEGDFAKARRIMLALLPLTSLLERGGKYMQCVKFACAFHGLPAGPVRKPLRPMEEPLAEEMRAMLTTARAEVAAILAEGGGAAAA